MNYNSKKTFPENTPEIIKSLLEKYNLETMQELFSAFKQAGTDEEKKKIQARWNNLPGPHIAKILKEFAQNEIKDDASFIGTIKERLSVSEELAQKLAKDLQEKILVPLQAAPEESEQAKKTEGASGRESNSPKKPDVYREPVE